MAGVWPKSWGGFWGERLAVLGEPKLALPVPLEQLSVLATLQHDAGTGMCTSLHQLQSLGTPGWSWQAWAADARLKEEQATCPNCRCEISKSLCCRNLAVEKAVSELPSECGFCLRQFPRSLLERHQKEECQDR
ncbi:hypothetical protein P7K49_026672 [Saguinus oedipus]|uniref:Cysteine-rich DPF motif domain-containing protein 1 n=1 Tax=Saguinus oedipus TaxID=9490 RepID=A0ABQ9UEA0_SAGOE|nr:hypothetical protein P7K49_026672 [Saguinus oedipus]